MVFSLFKKTAEKMPERKAARPKPLTPPAQESAVWEPAAEQSGTAASAPPPAAPSATQPAAAEAPKQELPPLEFGDSQFDFTDSAVMAIEVDQDTDPVQADVEQAAVLFANGQDAVARAVLETSARSHTGAPAERLWRMLLDLVQVLGDRAAFDRLGEEFAQVCETSPPAWRSQNDRPAVKAAVGGRKLLVLQGVLTGGEGAELAQLKAAILSKEAPAVDFSRLASCDEEAAAALMDCFRLAKKLTVAISMEGGEGLVGRLETRLVVGEPATPQTWLLLLEMLQLLGRQEAFEEKAVDYAVTFEVSPPSWEPLKTAVKAPRPGAPAPVVIPPSDIHFLTGELKNCRFDDLRGFFELHERPVIDFSGVKRLDFFSAGLLRNILEPIKRQGKEVIIRDPNHLVAELMGIVDLPSVARIIVPKT